MSKIYTYTDMDIYFVTSLVVTIHIKTTNLKKKSYL